MGSYIKPCIKRVFFYCKISPIISFLVFFLYLSSSVPPVFSSKPHDIHQANQTFRPGKEVHKLKLHKLKLISTRLISLLSRQFRHFSSTVKVSINFLFFLSYCYVNFQYVVESRWWFHRMCASSSATTFWSSSFEMTKTIGTWLKFILMHLK